VVISPCGFIFKSTVHFFLSPSFVYYYYYYHHYCYYYYYFYYYYYYHYCYMEQSPF
jgi:hypothetical protein